MKSLLRKFLFGILTVALLGALGTGLWQWYRVATRPSMEKSGGTVLVYELDMDKLPDGQLPADYQPEEMIAALKRRLDPSEDLGIVVRPVEAHRVEISIPRAGDHDAQVQQVKELVSQIGLLEFRILANEQDDKEGIAAARSYFEAINDPNQPEAKRNERRAEEDQRAERGLPPRGPIPADGKTAFRWSNPWASGEASYSWVELGRSERWSQSLDNRAEADPKRNQRWQQVAKARAEGRIITLPDVSQTVLFSRRCQNLRMFPSEQASKQYEYFFLTRDPKPTERMTSKYLVNVTAVADANQQPAVNFQLSTPGSELFHALTSQNKPSGSGDERSYRHLAIMLDDSIVSAPRLNDAIRSEGRIIGNFTQPDIERFVNILRAGVLPAALKPFPVSETVVEPTKK